MQPRPIGGVLPWLVENPKVNEEPMGRGLLSVRGWQVDDERSAFSHLALHPDPPTVS